MQDGRRGIITTNRGDEVRPKEPHADCRLLPNSLGGGFSMSRLLLFVGVGGLGEAAVHYVLSGYVQQATRSAAFPYGTLAVNVLGCFVIGLLSQLMEPHGLLAANTTALLLPGFLGGFTTFSTFGNETMNLSRRTSPSPWRTLLPMLCSVWARSGQGAPSPRSSGDDPMTNSESCILRIFVGESDGVTIGLSMSGWSEAKTRGMAGATVFRGIIKSARTPRTSHVQD